MSDIPNDVLNAARKVVVEDLGMDSPGLLQTSYIDCIAEAILEERERSLQLLSEAEKREREAGAKALEEAAKVAEAERMRHSTGSGFDSYPSHTTAFKIREAIRALQSEER